jgi:hypothetical protein
MNIKSNSRPLRTVLATMIAFIFASAVPLWADDELFASIPSATGQSQSELSKRKLPFSLQDFVLFASENFNVQPIESGSDYARFIYSERARDGEDVEIMRIMIRAREAYLQVAFSFREFNVMHYVAEFMEGPFFTRAESEQLYALLYEPSARHTWKPVGRFQARVTMVNGNEGTEALFEFAAATNPGQR